MKKLCNCGKDKPNKKEISEFLDIFQKLESFEASQRFIRGYGAFSENDCPNPSTVKTISWLKKIAGIKEIEVTDKDIEEFKTMVKDAQEDNECIITVTNSSSGYITYDAETRKFDKPKAKRNKRK